MRFRFTDGDGDKRSVSLSIDLDAPEASQNLTSAVSALRTAYGLNDAQAVRARLYLASRIHQLTLARLKCHGLYPSSEEQLDSLPPVPPATAPSIINAAYAMVGAGPQMAVTPAVNIYKNVLTGMSMAAAMSAGSGVGGDSAGAGQGSGSGVNNWQSQPPVPQPRRGAATGAAAAGPGGSPSTTSNRPKERGKYKKRDRSGLAAAGGKVKPSQRADSPSTGGGASASSGGLGKSKPGATSGGGGKRRLLAASSPMLLDEDNAPDGSGGDADEDVDDIVGEDDGNVDYCGSCGIEGDLLCCDRCPRSYHTDCLKMGAVPDGEWLCPECVYTFGAKREHEGSATSGPIATALFRGPWTAPGTAGLPAGRLAPAESLAIIVTTLTCHEFAGPFKAELGVLADRLSAAPSAGKAAAAAAAAGSNYYYGGKGGGAAASAEFAAARAITDLRLVWARVRAKAVAASAAAARASGSAAAAPVTSSTTARMADVMFRECETALRGQMKLTAAQSEEVNRMADAELQ